MGFSSFLEILKARSVTKGLNQTARFDFSKTFIPVAKNHIIGVTITIRLAHGWDLRQVDVNNEFLHRLLDEEV